MTDILETLKESLILQDQEIGELASTWEVPKDLFTSIVKEACEDMEQEPEVAERLSFYHKTEYLCDKAFSRGILTALYIYNETMKATLDDLIKMKNDSGESTATTETTK